MKFHFVATRIALTPFKSRIKRVVNLQLRIDEAARRKMTSSRTRYGQPDHRCDRLSHVGAALELVLSVVCV